MKVKIFTDYNEDCLCENINKWIEEKGVAVVDMKYSNVADVEGHCFYTVLVMFKDY